MTEITQGIFYDMPYEQYDALPAVRAGFVKNVTKYCPKVAKYKQDNPEDKVEWEFGKAAHLYYLEPDKFETAVAFLDFKDWRTDAAKAKRGAAKLEGKIALLEKDREQLYDMRVGFFENTVVVDYLQDYKAEVTLVWFDPDLQIWCKARPDIMGQRTDGRKFMGNFKTAASVHPVKFQTALSDMGYAQEADWYLQGYKIITGEILDYVFFAQEKKAPYVFAPYIVGQASMQNAFAENRRALKIVKNCLETGVWYGYRSPTSPDKDTVMELEMPTWALYRSEERMELEADEGEE